MQFTQGTIVMNNTFCIFGDDSSLDWSPMTAQGLADHIGGSLLPSKWQALLTAGATLDSVTVRELLAPGDLSVPDEGVHTLALTGTRSATDTRLPTPMCALLHIATNAAVRSGHGRMFLPPIIDSGALANGGTIGPTVAYQTAITGLITELGHWNKGGSHWLSGSTWGVGVYSRTRRAKGLPQFAFSAVAYSNKNLVHWLESRQR